MEFCLRTVLLLLLVSGTLTQGRCVVDATYSMCVIELQSLIHMAFEGEIEDPGTVT